MVCVQQIMQGTTEKQQINKKQKATTTIMDETEKPSAKIVEKSWLGIMNGDGEHLELKHLVGGNIVRYPPIFSEIGNFLFLRETLWVNVYSSETGELVRQLVGAPSELISMEFELKEPHIMVACTKDAEVVRWDWRTGELKEIKKLNLEDKIVVLNFNLLKFYHNSDRAAAFIIYKNKHKAVIYNVVNTSTGKIINVPRLPAVKLYSPMVAVDTKLFDYLVIINDCYVHFVDYKHWKYNRLRNALHHEVTAVAFHPTECCVATGDITGQIFLWRNFMDKMTSITVLYHWHHTPVTSIAFSESGTSFYSSGHEAVLVRWNVENPEQRNYVPRMNSIIRHIAVQKDNEMIAVCTDDNGVQFLDSANYLTHTLQEFTYTTDDKTGLTKFPIGLKKNPRSNTLVLNGRVGHLQFFSAYTKSLLYNLNIVNQNALSMEASKILYNIRVTKAAFNINWMATGEVFNDNQHSPELRLKFWKYQKRERSYELNTNIELPHEDGFRAIEFSSSYEVDNLLCATVGEENLIRIWALQSSDNIYRPGTYVWGCIAQTNYKNMPIESICFSQDGSLLAAGFGNILCIYTADNLKLKAALNSTAGFDGCAQKTRISLLVPNKTSLKTSTKQTVDEKHCKPLQLFQNILESNDRQHIKSFNNICGQQSVIETNPKIPKTSRTIIFNKILRTPGLNLFQKLQVFHKLNIRCEVRKHAQMFRYLNKTISPKILNMESESLQARLHRLSIDKRFKAKYRLEQHRRYHRVYDAKVTQQLAPIISVLSPADAVTTTENISPEKAETVTDETPYSISSLPQPAQITHVQFAAGEYAHLVVVCTRTRLLIWNLLTLRLQSALRISVKHLAFDQNTNLMAAFTHKQDLHIFQPNVPLPIYQRSGLPDLYDLTWVPRRYPKSVSINVDWQSQATLFMLTEDQAIKYLGTPNAKDDDVPSAVRLGKPVTNEVQYTTFGTYATKKYVEKEPTRSAIGPLIIGNSGKSAVKAITEMSTHTMPPLSLLCADFVKAFAKLCESKSQKEETDKTKLTNGNMNGHDSHSDSETEESNYLTSNNNNKNSKKSTAVHNLKLRKTILAKSEELTQNKKLQEAKKQQNLEKRLQHIAKQSLELEF